MYQVLVALVKIFIGWKLNITVVGKENLPKKGPTLVVFNHTDYLDTLAIMFSLKRQLTAFVASEYGEVRSNGKIHFEGLLVRLFWLVGSVIFVSRGQSDTGALKNGLKVLKKEKFLVLSPEGTRDSTDTLTVGKFGPAYLAATTSATVIPVGIVGTFGGFRVIVKTFFSRSKVMITVTIGKPFKLAVEETLKTSNFGDSGIKDRWQEITNKQIMPRLVELLPAEMHGVFADL